MKHLTFFLLVVFAAVACQKDTTNAELESILAKEALDENVHQLANECGMKIMYIMSDTRTTVCNGPDFTDVLKEFVPANQTKANELCEAVRGPVSGCLNGFMTYGSGMVYPESNTCENFVEPVIDPYH